MLKSASVFARCHPLVNPEPFVALCEMSLCSCTQGLACVCPALLEYARTCAQEGIVLYGWMDHSTCRESLLFSSPGVGHAISVLVASAGNLSSCSFRTCD